jgi:hypothetical protein
MKMWKTFLLGAAKSKTVNFNVLFSIALAVFLKNYDIELTGEEAALATGGIYAVANLILRTVTGTSLPQKGLEVKLPKYSDILISKVVEVVEDGRPSKDEIVRGVIDYMIERQRAGKSLVEVVNKK